MQERAIWSVCESGYFVSGFWVLRGGCSNLYSGSVELDCGRYPSLVGESGTVCGKGCWVAEIGAAEVLHSFEDCTVDHLLQLASKDFCIFF